MNLIRWRDRGMANPFSDFERWQEELNRLFTSEQADMQGLFERAYSPSIDIVESIDDVIVRCDLPGVDLKDVDVSIASNVLTIKGEKKESGESKSTRLYRKETWDGSFQRTLSLPSTVDPDKVSADLKNGILTIVFKKREEVRPRQISVQSK